MNFAVSTCEERNLNDSSRLLRSQWILLNRNGREIGMFNHYLRLYSLLELKTLLCKAGISVLGVYGSYEGQQYERNSLRVIGLARKV